MMLKCLDCGHIFEHGEEQLFVEPHGEERRGCPLCGGDYDDTVSCEVCGTQLFEEDTTHGMCKRCFDEWIDGYRHDFDACLKVSVGETELVEINSLVASLLDEDDINQILREYVVARFGKSVDCSAFIDTDVDWFAEEAKLNERW